jgi:hypothetical protein
VKSPPVLAIIEDRDLLAGKDGLGEFEQRHVRPAPRAIDGEEAQAGGRQAAVSFDFSAAPAGVSK